MIVITWLAWGIMIGSAASVLAVIITAIRSPDTLPEWVAQDDEGHE